MLGADSTNSSRRRDLDLCVAIAALRGATQRDHADSQNNSFAAPARSLLNTSQKTPMMASLRPRLTAIALLLPAVSARHLRSLTPLSQLSSMPVIQRRTCAIVARGGRGRKRRDKGPPREPRTLQHSLDGQPPEIARTYPEQYDELLSTKVGLLETLLTDATGGGPLPPMEVFESQRENFRMRASFATWREEEKIYYIMFQIRHFCKKCKNQTKNPTF